MQAAAGLDFHHCISAKMTSVLGPRDSQVVKVINKAMCCQQGRSSVSWLEVWGRRELSGLSEN